MLNDYPFLTAIGIVILTRPFTVFVHEFGHALPLLFFTKDKVTVFLGSHGDKSNSFRIKVDLLEIWLLKNPFIWKSGLCIPPKKEISINKQIIYTLAGPIASLILALIAAFLAYYFDFSKIGGFAIFVFFISAIFDLFHNLTPNKRQIVLNDGTVTYNDGAQLEFLFFLKRISRDKTNPIQLYHEGKYAEAAELFQIILQRAGHHREFIYGLALSALLQIGDYKQAKIIGDEYLKLSPKNTNDYVNIGLANSFLDFHETALECYEKALEVNAENIYALNNIGFTYNNMGKYEEVIQLMNKLISIDANFSHAYSNRGLAKIKTGIFDGGLEDLNHSLKLDAKNAYAYRNIGIYHLEKNEKEEALKNFKKAKELNTNTYKIDELIAFL